MRSIQTVLLLIVVLILLTTGAAKVFYPGKEDVLPESVQIVIGLAESAAAITILVRKRRQILLVWLCAAGAGIGVLFHTVLATQGKTCGCLGGFTPRGLGPAMAAALGACSCLWLSFQSQQSRRSVRELRRRDLTPN